MQSMAFGLALLLGALLTFPIQAQAPGALDKGPAAPTTEKMVKAGQVTGVVKTVSESTKSIRIQIETVTRKLNPGALNSMQQAKRELLRAQYNRNPASRARAILRAQQKLAKAQRDLYKLERHSQEIEINAADDVVVRRMNPPQQFDDKGQIKQLTREEKRKLKGPNPRLPGYMATFADLAENQVVTVQLIRKRGRPRIPRKIDEGDAVALLADFEPKASMILIVR
jgi:hypothetical protein